MLLQIRVERPKARGEVAAGKEGLVAPGGQGSDGGLLRLGSWQEEGFATYLAYVGPVSTREVVAPQESGTGPWSNHSL